jgi:hypothetical protein
MSQQPLPPERHEEAERIYQILKARIDTDLRQLAELLASKEDHQIFGATEFEVRDRVHRIGAEAIQTALEERKKRGTKVPVVAAPLAKKGRNSSAGRRKHG